MPKVDNISLEWLGEYTNFEIHFNKSKAFFIKDIPEQITKFSDNFNNREKDLFSIRNNFTLALHHATTVMTSSSEVLLIKLSITTDSYKALSNQHGQHGHVKKNDEFAKFNAFGSNMEGIGFSMDCTKASALTVEGSTTYYNIGIKDHGRYGRIFLKDNMVVIPYTKEVENSFKDIQSSLLQMIIKVSEFYNNSPDVIAKALLSGNMLALGK